MNANTTVLKTNAGRHFHLFADCAALETGRRNSEKAGREIHVEMWVPFAEAIDDAMFGCIACHKRAGVSLAPEADRKAVYAARAAARLAKREAKAAALAAKATPVAEVTVVVETPAVVDTIDADVERMLNAIITYLSQFGLTVAAA